jgi:cellulose synthase/poly-beta-1,6-N-acetylglucosamine synthase-like glycosyltransferase
VSGPHVSLHERTRAGKSFAINSATPIARGKIIAFVDDDVIVDPQWLTDIIESFRRDTDLGLLLGRVVPARVGEPAVAVTVGVEEHTLSPKKIGGLIGPNLAVRREVLDAVGSRDTRLGPGRGLAGEDFDFVYRVLKAGFHGRFSPRPTVTHRPGQRIAAWNTLVVAERIT